MESTDPSTSKRTPLSNWGKIRSYVMNDKPDDKPDGKYSRWNSIIKGGELFFGVSGNSRENQDLKNKWNTRLDQLYGGKGMMVLKKHVDDGGEMALLGTDSVDGRFRKKRLSIRPKDNVLKMAYDALRKKDSGVPTLKSRSFTQSDTQRGKLDMQSQRIPTIDTDFFKVPQSTGQRKLKAPSVKRMKRMRRPGAEGEDAVDSFLPSRDMIDSSMLEELSDTHKREIGTGGFIGRRLFNIEQDAGKISKKVQKELDEMGDVLYRPYFTYWVTFVQIVCYIVTVSVYGFAPIGINYKETTSEIYSSKMFIESMTFVEMENFWIGARQEDLIHLGAKYSPCMRKDTNVVEAILKDRSRENNSACCVRNDGLGCVQTPSSKCSSILSTWHKNDQGTTVCGQDPNYCSAPASVDPFKWPTDIVDWPICKESTITNGTSLQGIPRHMTCQVAGKPCCIGIQGECLVTTREECEFKRGYFHDEAFLCSQISCMQETCGMLPFWNSSRPDQFYRLWLSLFIHAGVIQLLITILFQFFFMRDVEKLMGWHRTAFIYLMSGVVGSLASAIFVPYHVEAGPSGSQFGILSCLFVELINYWSVLVKPYLALIKLSLILLLLFIIGLLPMIDNYAHLFGFAFGFLLSFSVMPHVELSISDRRKKLVAVFACFFGSFVILLVLTLLFYVVPIYNCPYCQYFSCIPFTENFCSSMEVKIRRDTD